MLMSKTFWTAIVTVVVTIVKVFGVEIPNEVFIGLGSLGAIFMRYAIKKGVEDHGV